MKRLIATLTIVAALDVVAQAESYFRPAFNESHAGIFQKLGTPNDSMALGFVIPAVTHESSDGFWFIPGVDWDLLDIGYTHTTENANLFVFGPSVNLSEPVKTGLRFLSSQLFPSWSQDGRYSLLKGALAEAKPGEAPSGALAMGIGEGVTVRGWSSRFWQGSAQLSLTVIRKF